MGYNRGMKAALTYRMLTLLTIALVFAPILNYNISWSMGQDNMTRQHISTAVSSECHQTSDKTNCQQCGTSLESHSCDHDNDSCDGHCGLSVVSIALMMQIIDNPKSQQVFSDLFEYLALSIDPDTDLHPPKFA